MNLTIFDLVLMNQSIKAMNPPDFQIPEHQITEVFSEAVRLHTEKTKNYSLDELVQIGLEADIPPEITKQAAETIRKRYLLEQERQSRIQAQKADIQQTILHTAKVLLTIAIYAGGTLLAIALLLAGFQFTQVLDSRTTTPGKTVGKIKLQAPAVINRRSWQDKSIWRTRLQQGMTTAEVRQLFKEPEDVIVFSGGSSIWYYGEGHIWFDQSGRLESWSDP